MKSSTTLVFTFVFIAFLFLFSWGYAKRGTTEPVGAVNTAPTETHPGALSTQETFYDFGTISMKNGKVTKDFVITNTSDQETVMRTLITSCMCTTAFIVLPDGTEKGPFGMPGHGGSFPAADETIPAGESRTVRVIFDPNAHGPAGVGTIDRIVTMTDSTGGTLTLEIKAVVTP